MPVSIIITIVAIIVIVIMVIIFWFLQQYNRNYYSSMVARPAASLVGTQANRPAWPLMPRKWVGQPVPATVGSIIAKNNPLYGANVSQSVNPVFAF